MGHGAPYPEDGAFLLGLLLEHDLLLERNAERERVVTASLERRLTRLADGLHHGPLQNLASLAADVALMRKQLSPALDAVTAARVNGRLDDLQSQLESLDR